MKKKTLLLVTSLALVLVCAIGGTLAWLTADASPVKNTFTTSDIEITLEETTGVEYKMVPGYTIAKDPKASVVSGSEECYLFVQLNKSQNFDTFMTFEMAEGWTAVEGAENVYYRVVMQNEMETDFSVLKNNQVQVKDTVTKDMMNGLTQETYPTLTVNAYASQYHKNASEVFTPVEAWNVVNDAYTA